MTEADSLDEARRRAMRAEYVARINRVIDHIEANLGSTLALDDLAEVAAFSPYHFHRIFKAMVGENLAAFIRRRRVEKAASLLLSNPSRPITQVALECGFSSPAAFARVFRESFGMSASDWIRAGGAVDSKNREGERNEGQQVRKPRQATPPAIRILDPVTRNWLWRLSMNAGEARVEVRSVPEMHVAYLRHIGPYAGDNALFGRLFGRLFSWAGPRGLIGADTKVVSIYEDDPDITDEERLRVDVALSVPVGTSTDGEIGTRTIPAGTYAVGHFEILPREYSEAWQTMMGQWLPESGWQCGDGPCLEMYLNQPGDDPEATHIVELYVPVKPL
jgi:AraC family transcriptional regulator